MGRVDRTDRGGMYMEEFAGLGSSVWSLSLQNWARDGNGARSFCVCVWSCRSWNQKLHLLWTFTISIGGKETLSDIMKWRIKLEGHFVPIVAAEVRCSLDLQHLGPCAAPHEPAVLWCGRVSQHFGIAFKIDAKKKKKVLSNTSLKALNVLPLQGSRDAVWCYQVVESLPCFLHFM